MTTVPYPRSTVQFDTTLRTLAAQARCRYAGEGARLDRGLVIALNGGVTLHADGTASVRSQSDAAIVYTVGRHCDCPDAARAPEGRCKHRWARCFVTRATQAVPTPLQWYASSYAPDGTCVQGTAQQVAGHGWVFIDAEGGDIVSASLEALVLGGRVDILEAQRQADGDLVTKVCHQA
jgi:hypothetical protein